MNPSKVHIVVGPPGTGKTTYLLKILEKELKNYDPDKIAFVSFTKAGAYEGRDRAIEKFDYSEDDLPYFKTLHSIAFKAANARPNNMMNFDDRKKLGKILGYNFKYNFTSDLNKNDSIYLFYIDAYRNNAELGKQIVETHYLNVKDLLYIENHYKEYKKVYNKIDYTDLIELFIKGNKPIPVKVAIIDEAQDLTTLQWDMVEIAFRDCDKIYIAGDDDQAIYEWAGADVKRFINLKGSLEVLRHSYRLPKNILSFSKTITHNISNRIQKDFEPANDGGSIARVDQDLNYEFATKNITINKDESYLFLVRNKFYLGAYKEALIKQGIPFKMEGKVFHQSRDIEAINAYTRMQKNIALDSDQTRALNRLIKPGSFKKHLIWYDGLKFTEEMRSYYRALIQNKADTINEPNIDLRTIHSVKGAETDHVFINLNITKAVKNNLLFNPDSEHRVFYVGVTRARKSVTIVLPNQRNYYDIDFQWITNNDLLEQSNRWKI